MASDVEVTDEFQAWFKAGLDDDERESVVAAVDLLEEGTRTSVPPYIRSCIV